MTNRLALVIGLVLLAGLVADQMLNAGTATLFLGQKFVGLVDAVAFWR